MVPNNFPSFHDWSKEFINERDYGILVNFTMPDKKGYLICSNYREAMKSYNISFPKLKERIFFLNALAAFYEGVVVILEED